MPVPLLPPMGPGALANAASSPAVIPAAGSGPAVAGGASIAAVTALATSGPAVSDG